MGTKKRDDYVSKFFTRPDDIRIVCILGNRGSGKKLCLNRLKKYLITINSSDSTTRLEEVKCSPDESICRTYVYPYDDSDKMLQVLTLPEFDTFNPELYSMFLMCDGAILVVDCTLGLDDLLENQIKKAFSFNLKCVLILNKIDLLLENNAISSSEIYARLYGMIESINLLISTYSQEEGYFHPLKGNVIFTSCLLNYAFTPRNFGKLYSRKYGIEESYFTNILWGDYYYDPRDKKTKPLKTSTSLARSFCQFCIEPIRKALRILKFEGPEIIKKLCRTIRVSITDEDLAEGEAKLKKLIFKQWLRYTDTVLDAISTHCPSPIMAQTTKFENFYEGELNETCAIAMRDSIRRSPLMVYVVKLLPVSRKLLGLARVFSGTLNTDSRVRAILHYADAESFVRYVEIKELYAVASDCLISVSSISVGNIVVIGGLDNAITRSATLSDNYNAKSIIIKPYSELPIFRASVSVAEAGALPRLINRLKLASKLEPKLDIKIDDAGQIIVSAWNEQYLTDFIRRIEDSIDTPITQSEIYVRYKETITKHSPSISQGKSKNKANKLYADAEPIAEGLSSSIESGSINLAIRNCKEISVLHEDYEWNLKDLSSIWCFGPRNYGSNFLVNCTKSVPFLNEVKDVITSSFQTVCSNGVLCDEELRGVRINLRDAVLSSAPIQRGGGQIMPAARKCFYASCLSASPALMEPICECNIICPHGKISQLYQTLEQRGGKILQERQDFNLNLIRAHLPGSNLVSISSELSEYSASIDYTFHSWRIMPGDVLSPSCLSYEVMMSLRRWKGLKLQLPRYNDRLIPES
jgi:elongation factor 2